MPATTPRPRRARTGLAAAIDARTATAPVPARPETCENGYTMHYPVESVAIGPVPRHVPVVYVPGETINPRYRSPVVPSGAFAAGLYVVPTNYCAVNRPAPGETGQCCNYCSQSWISYMSMVRDYRMSAHLIREESLLNRRLTWNEVLLLCNQASSMGFDEYRRIADRCCLHHADSLIEEVGKAHAAHTAQLEAARAERERARLEQQRAAMKVENERRRSLVKANRERVQIAKYLTTPLPKDEPVQLALASTSRGTRRRRLEECECERQYDEDDDRYDYETSTGRCECGYESGDGMQQLMKHRDHGMPFYASKADKNRRLVGVELEFNQLVNLDKWVQKWRGNIHEDGSCGWEAVTTPVAGCHVDQCVRDLTRALRNAGAEADDRCGIHVHVDAGDIGWEDMYRILAVYSKVEPILYLLAGQQRMNGQYCAPCGPAFGLALKSEDRKGAVIGVAINENQRGTSGREYARNGINKKDGGRYKGINIIPWLAGRREGKADTTIEFRLHRNSLDASRIVGWAQLCANIVEWCNSATDTDVANLPKSALRALCEVISPSSKAWIIRRVADWRRATTAERPRSGRHKTLDGGGLAAKRKVLLKGGVYSCAV